MLKQIEFVLRNFLLKILSSISQKNRFKTEKLNINSSSKVLLVRLNRIGDALVTTPFIHLLKEKTNCQIFILADKKNYFVFDNNLNIDTVFVFEKGLKGFFKTIKKLNSIGFNLIIDMHDDVSTTASFIIAATNSKFKLGLEKSNKNIFTHIVPRPDPNKFHVVERLCSFSKILGFDYDKNELKIIYNPNQSSISKVEDLINGIFNQKKFLLGINISAGSDARFWGIERYKLLIQKLKGYDINTVIISHSKDYEKALKIIESKYILGKLDDFSLFAASIKKLDMLFSPDTSAVHIAASEKIPVFGLYVKYKLDELIWSPFGSDFECVITEEPNLNNLKFEEVWEKFEPFLNKHLSIYNEYSKRV